MSGEKAIPASRVQSNRLTVTPVLILVAVAMILGANFAVVKIGARELTPLFMAGIRSLIASVCLAAWIYIKGLPLFPDRTIVLHGVVVGIVFGLQFALIYVGLQSTLASRVYVLVYIAPFVTALGAHFFLKGDRLNRFKTAGLVLAFCGILALFMKDLGRFTLDTLAGDLMIVGAGILWGGSTVYVKKFMIHRVHSQQTQFFCTFFSMPLLFLLSAVCEGDVVHGLSWAGVLSVAYQSILVVFVTYTIWMELIYRYPASLIHAFSFFTPVFGVAISGVLLLGEPVGWNIVSALVLVSLGLILVNRPVRSVPS